MDDAPGGELLVSKIRDATRSMVKLLGTEGFVVNVISSALFVLVALGATVVYTSCQARYETRHRLAETLQQFEIEDYKSNQAFLSDFALAVPRALDMQTRLMMHRNYMKWAERKRLAGGTPGESPGRSGEFPRHPVSDRTYEDISKERYGLHDMLFEKPHPVAMCSEIATRFAAGVTEGFVTSVLNGEKDAGAIGRRIASLSTGERLCVLAEVMVRCFREINGVSPSEKELRESARVIREMCLIVGLPGEEMERVKSYTAWYDQQPGTEPTPIEVLHDRSDDVLRAYSPLVNYLASVMIEHMSALHADVKRRLGGAE